MYILLTSKSDVRITCYGIDMELLLQILDEVKKQLKHISEPWRLNPHLFAHDIIWVFHVSTLDAILKQRSICWGRYPCIKLKAIWEVELISLQIWYIFLHFAYWLKVGNFEESVFVSWQERFSGEGCKWCGCEHLSGGFWFLNAEVVLLLLHRSRME